MLIKTINYKYSQGDTGSLVLFLSSFIKIPMITHFIIVCDLINNQVISNVNNNRHHHHYKMNAFGSNRSNDTSCQYDPIDPKNGQKDTVVQLVLSLGLGVSAFLAFCVGVELNPPLQEITSNFSFL